MTRPFVALRPLVRVQSPRYRQVAKYVSTGRLLSINSSQSRFSNMRNLATAAASTNTSQQSAPPPLQASSQLPSDAQISRIVDDISGLTLLQAADLVSLLKSRLNIQEIAAPVAAPAAAIASATAAPAEEEKPKEKTIFNVKLESFDAAAKPKVIREIKSVIPNLNLIEAKKFVESAPRIIKENLPKEEAEKLKSTFEALGAVVILE